MKKKGRVVHAFILKIATQMLVALYNCHIELYKEGD